MTTKGELKRIRTSLARVARLELEIEHLYDSMMLVSPKMSDMPKSRNHEDKMAEKFSMIDERDYKCVKELRGIKALKSKAEHDIDMLSSPMLKDVIELYYLKRRPTWDDVAEELGYSVRQVHNLHSKALAELKRVQ